MGSRKVPHIFLVGMLLELFVLNLFWGDSKVI